MSARALLTFSIGPVHTFIAQARRVADLWAGSELLSSLISQAILKLREEPTAAMVFPYLESKQPIPPGLPNRFVCDVPAKRAAEIAAELERAVRAAWRGHAASAIELLRQEPYRFKIGAPLWRGPEAPQEPDQVEAALSCAWSWVPLGEGTEAYGSASIAGAQQFAASRLFRPFLKVEESGEKCAICGERTALPNGQRAEVSRAWAQAEKQSTKPQDTGFFRLDQTRLCLVCATKRFFPRKLGWSHRFQAFKDFEPQLGDDRGTGRSPYVALVEMDGDRLGRLLGLPGSEIEGGDVRGFHREVSEALTRFAGKLRSADSQDLNLESLCWAPPCHHNSRPQLIYAGGEDVRFVCDPRHALPLAHAVKELYEEEVSARVAALLLSPERREKLSISAAILIAHTKHPAGQMFRDVEGLLKTKAKGEAGRNAMAIRLAKRGGAPEEEAFRWSETAPTSEKTWVEQLRDLVTRLEGSSLSSGQTFDLRREEETLSAVFGKDEERWRRWLVERLSRGELSSGHAEELAGSLVPFFVKGKTAALRIARFLGREVGAREVSR